MKNFLLLSVVITVIFSSCSKEEELLNSTESFSCKIEGSNFETSTITTANSEGNISIIADDGVYNIVLKILNINSRSSGDVISFSSPSLAIIMIGGAAYSNTYFDSTKGEITITNLDLSIGKVSGTFFFEAQDVTPNVFVTKNITEGEFLNISF